MSESLSKVWSRIENYLSDGFSIIPVADKEVTYKGKAYHPKQAIGKWEGYQKSQITKQYLWDVMDEAGIAAVAIVGGKVSGNLEIIDIDVKYNPGIDATLFQDLKQLYPEIFAKLRIHKTPSGGYHILYRVSGGDVPGNLKLAGRNASEEEIAAQIAKGSKRPTKIFNFLETRGEGGYVVAPPSLGYTISQDVPICEISWEERCSIIALCSSYSQIIKIEKPAKVNRNDDHYYDENPFEHFNNTCDPVSLITGFGWSLFKHNSRFIWFTRPGSDKQGKNATTSASFNLQKRVFYVFTSSTELEPAKGYLPSTLLAELQFGGDKKRTYAYLVEQGYGRVKPHVEKKNVRLAAIRGGNIPQNFSKEAKQELEAEKQIIVEKYPFGIFWIDEDDDIKISRVKLYAVAEGLGFFRYDQSLVFKTDHVVEKIIDKNVLYDALRNYVQEEEGFYKEEIINSLEAFLQRAGEFTISRLQQIKPEAFIKDDRNNCFKFYKNGFLVITKNGHELMDYSAIHGYVWKDQIRDRDFKEGAGGIYLDFLSRATDYNQYTDHIKKIHGWLAHGYKDETTGYIIALTEQCPDPKHGGGSGKNLFCSLFSNVTSYTSINGAQVKKYDEAFLQTWNGEKLFCISDPKKDFDWGFLKEFATGAGIVKKLYHDQRTIPVEDMPKFIVATNFSYEISDGGLKRRIIGMEFNSFFTQAGGVDTYYDKHFPKGWTAEDWAGYDTFIAQCITLWISCGLKLKPVGLTEGGWLKQFDQMFGQLTREFIQGEWEYWKKKGFITNETFNDAYQKFCIDNNIAHNFRLSSMKMNRALQEWCEHHNIYFAKDHPERDEFGKQVRGRQFLEAAPF